MPISAPPPSWASIKNKPTTVSGFGITDAFTSAQVGAANANLAYGAIGTYFENFTTLGTSVGGTVAGSSLTYQNSSFATVSAGLSGTWRNMGGAVGVGANPASQLFLRIS